MKVRFVPGDKEVEIKSNETVLSVANREGIPIKSVCKGIPSCAECRVYIVEGENNVLPPSAAELSLIGSAHFVDHRRLSCQLRCYGDITIDVSEQQEKLKGKTADPESQKVSGNIIFESQNREDAFERKAQSILDKQERELTLKRLKQNEAGTGGSGFYKGLWNSQDSSRSGGSQSNPRREEPARAGSQSGSRSENQNSGGRRSNRNDKPRRRR